MTQSRKRVGTDTRRVLLGGQMEWRKLCHKMLHSGGNIKEEWRVSYRIVTVKVNVKHLITSS
jgi:hypothetical protein